MDQAGYIKIEQGHIPPNIDLDLARVSFSGTLMALCGGGLLWWVSIQYQSASMSNAVLAGALWAALAIPSIACIALPVWGAIRMAVLKRPAFRVADGRLSSIYFSPLNLDAVEAIYVVKRRVWGFDFDEVRIGTSVDRKSRTLPLWALEKAARLQIAEAATDATKAS